MKKTIIKTAVITALLLLCSVFIIYFAIYIVSPGTIGDMYKNLGMKNNAVEMYEKQYLSKGNAFDDLKELVDMAIYAEDEERVAEYGKILTVDQSVKLKLLSDASKKEGVRDIYDYYSTRTVEGFYKIGNKAECVSIAFMTSESYGEDKSVYFVAMICSSGNDKELATEFIDYYDNGAYKNNITSGRAELVNLVFSLKEKYDLK